MTLPGHEHKGYPWRKPKRDGMGQYIFRGWDIDFGTVKKCPHCGERHEDGQSHQGTPDPRVVVEMERLRDAVCPLGWDLTWDMLNVEATWEDDFMCDTAMAFLHIFINGETSWAGETLSTGYGIRICGDELTEQGLDDRDAAGQVTAAQCLEELVKQLPEHVDLIIAHLRAYPAYERSIQ